LWFDDWGVLERWGNNQLVLKLLEFDEFVEIEANLLLFEIRSTHCGL
jgi:hypothetical protein